MAREDAERVEAKYLERLRHVLRRAPAEVREDAVREVKSHIEDEWQASGAGDVAALEAVLERMGPPETYGRDLALQLILMQGGKGRSLVDLGLASLFWASTSLSGAAAVLLAALTLAFGIGMIAVGAARMAGSNVALINAVGYRVLMIQGDRLIFPPDNWSPVQTVLVGIVPAFVVIGGLYIFSRFWLHSRLAAHGLDLVIEPGTHPLPRDWDKSAIRSVVLLAGLSLGACILLVFAGNLVGIGRPGHLDLPSDFWRTPLGVFAALSLLVFFLSPVLGLLWSIGRARR